MASSCRVFTLLALVANAALVFASDNDIQSSDFVASVNSAGDVVSSAGENVLSATEHTGPRKLQQSVKPRGSGFWTVAGQEFLDADGRIVKFAGVQWGGIETDGAPHGLWIRNYNDMLAQIKSLGFNMIRLSFSGASMNPYVHPFGIGINYQLNPDLQGLNCISVMDKIVQACGTHGLKVILDYHRVNFTAANEGGAWFDIYSPEMEWVNNWAKLAIRYKGLTQVLGADMFNEPHPNPDINPKLPVWAPDGKNEPYNFRTACFRAASAIQAVNKDWIIFISGLWQGTWWGGNLVQVGAHPLAALPVPGKLAYSAHDYGPYVYWQGYFNVSSYPDNMPAIWDKNWGYLMKQNRYPVWIGEWGGFYAASNSKIDQVEDIWLNKLTSYIRNNQLSHTWFNWGPDSKDTGGILLDDWKSVDMKKLGLLQKIMHPNFGPSPGQSFKQQRKNVGNYRQKLARRE